MNDFTPRIPSNLRGRRSTNRQQPRPLSFIHYSLLGRGCPIKTEESVSCTVISVIYSIYKYNKSDINEISQRMASCAGSGTTRENRRRLLRSLSESTPRTPAVSNTWVMISCASSCDLDIRFSCAFSSLNSPLFSSASLCQVTSDSK